VDLKYIQSQVRNGLYYLTEHADAEVMEDDFDIYDVERGILTGRIRKAWKQEKKYELIGTALDGRRIGIICRITASGKIQIITGYEDHPTIRRKGN
jgi:hypothetical protein